ncbi:MAG: sensor histidine kinase KdpD [Caldisericia bacterium]|nr:sensor histidine kinase KdpD [Caldisericia bacterium]
MTDDKRPDPDDILKMILSKEEEKNEESSGRGKLKIFLGLAAGVGKTFRMLTRAHAAKEQGIDVVVGVLETHGRAETQQLLEGLEVIPRKSIDYQGIKLDEMDIDAILARKPGLVLVDELAHTNVPTSRHEKRYQDVIELLDAGIDVWTTLNVQHIESFNDMVVQITGIKVKETVPDSVLEEAHHPQGIEVVDLPPDELLERLKEGKVYIPEKSIQAMQQFFRKGNLMALREMALRYVARTVDGDIRTYMERHNIQGPWSTSPRLLVCISPNSSSEKLIRLAKQLAPGIDAEWFAVHVETPFQGVPSGEQAKQLQKNIDLVNHLGGKMVILSGPDPAQEILEYSRKNNIIIILVGTRPSRRTSIGSQFAEAIIAGAGSIHVLVVNESGQGKKRVRFGNPLTWDFKNIVVSIGMLIAMAVLCWFFKPQLGYENIVILMLLPVLVSGILGGRIPGIINSSLGVIVLDFFFVNPVMSFTVDDLRLLPGFVAFLLIGIATSFVAEIVRFQGKRARLREKFVMSLYDFTKNLLKAGNADEVCAMAEQKITSIFETEPVIMIAHNDALVPAGSCLLLLTQNDKATAMWTLENEQPAGRHTDTLASATEYTFYPLISSSNIEGVMGLKLKEPLGSDQAKLLISFTNIIALDLSKFRNSKP